MWFGNTHAQPDKKRHCNKKPWTMKKTPMLNEHWGNNNKTATRQHMKLPLNHKYHKKQKYNVIKIFLPLTFDINIRK